MPDKLPPHVQSQANKAGELSVANDLAVKQWMKNLGLNPSTINDLHRHAYERSQATLHAMDAGQKPQTTPVPDSPK